MAIPISLRSTSRCASRWPNRHRSRSPENGETGCRGRRHRGDDGCRSERGPAGVGVKGRGHGILRRVPNPGVAPKGVGRAQRPAVLQQCIPGCETLEKVSDTELKATVRMKIGPVSAKFGGKVTLSDMDPPTGIASRQGQGGAALRQGWRRGQVDRRRRCDGADYGRRPAGGKIANRRA